MFRRFYPNLWLDSTYDIDFQQYYDKGYRGVIFDIDNTLVPHGAPAEIKAIKLFEKLKNIGLDSCVVSNNKEPRVASFAKKVKTKYIFKANKPSRNGYLKAMEQMGTNVNDTLFVGDQLFTDVWGANRTGIYTILVKPINPKEEIQIVLKRIPEKFILWCYKRR